MNEEISADLVLVGGGHAHVQILRRFMMAPLAGVRLSVVLDHPVAVYSGMVPGVVAGDYAEHEVGIDVVPLARRAGARVVLARATGVDPVAHRIELEGRPPIVYDVASFDVGSAVAGLGHPGVAEHALATRPIGDFVRRFGETIERDTGASSDSPLRVLVVGTGAAGLEIAFTLRARLRAERRAAEISVLGDRPQILEGYAPRVVRCARRAAERDGIEIHDGVRVARVEKDTVYSESGERFAYDWLLWAAGAAAHGWVRESPLPCNPDGFVRIEPTLQVVGHPDLFAVGDCASADAWPWMKKAGVYAVRQGPVLDANLRALLTGRPLRAYRPQRDFLTLLNLGERRALGSKWGFAVEGGWVFRLKDRIDRSFMRRFQVLAPDATPAATFPGAEKMGMQKMSCGGCAAKLDASALERALGRLPRAESDDSVVLGLSHPDDAAAFTLPRGDTLLTSVDAFSAFTDDPWLVGRVAAVNALSDIYATGGRPRHALALVTVPTSDGARSEETLYQVLAGIRAALDPLGVSLVGGHTTRGASLFVGLTVSGELEPSRSLLRSDALQVGDRLLLTKPLGTGVVLAADMQGLARGAWVQAAHASLLRVNRDAMEIAHRFDVRACTDVTGFGLAGHLAEMLRASDTSARVSLDALPALDGALELLARGVRSSAHAQNAPDRDAIAFVGSGAAGPAMELLFDPQTSGGLLLSVSESRSREAVRALLSAGDRNAVEIGRVMPARGDGVLFEVE